MNSARPDAADPARIAMIDSQLRPQGISDPAVLAAFGAVDRASFLPAGARAQAYSDRSVMLDDGGSMMAPAALGQLVQSLSPVAGERARVVGDPSGYVAALFDHLGLQPSADGEDADVILVAGSVDAVPDALVAALSEGGRLAAAIGRGKVSRLVVGVKSDGAFGLRAIGDASVPPLPGAAAPRAFTF